MITLKNLSKRSVVFNLPHEVACSETVCTCSRVKAGVVDHDKATGDRKVRAIHQRLAHSVTLLPRGTTEPVLDVEGKPTGAKRKLDEVSDLLDGVARIPEVVEAAKRFEIEIVRTKEAKPEAKPVVPTERPVFATPERHYESTPKKSSASAAPKE